MRQGSYEKITFWQIYREIKFLNNTRTGIDFRFASLINLQHLCSGLDEVFEINFVFADLKMTIAQISILFAFFILSQISNVRIYTICSKIQYFITIQAKLYLKCRMKKEATIS